MRQPELCAFFEEMADRWGLERLSIPPHAVTELFERTMAIIRHQSRMPRLSDYD